MAIFNKIELPTVKNIIIVASGKGGVGKSTISSNLAIALARQGQKVALVDADIYGPSIPKMFGLEDVRPEATKINEKEMILPVEKLGIKIISIGFFVDKSQGLIWRGPMASGAITQLFEDTHWGEIDYMVIDFPPGTGDIQLTIAQKMKLTGVIVVTTPQEVALIDARKAISMFSNDKISIPILGIVENMAWFSPAPHPDEKYFIFGKGGGELLAQETRSPLLAQIPLIAEVGEAADKGLSAFDTQNQTIKEAFEKMANQLLNR
jgi:ATP-binding protein involved in chromosome partitioning